jgi:hypothetical protein
VCICSLSLDSMHSIYVKLSFVAWMDIKYYCILSHKRHRILKWVTDHGVFTLIFSIHTSEICFLPKKNRARLDHKRTSTGQFMRPSGISNLCGTVAGMVTPKESVSTGGETLQISVLTYRCSICPNLVTPCTFKIDSGLANSKTKNAFLFPVNPMFRNDCPLAVKINS